MKKSNIYFFLIFVSILISTFLPFISINGINISFLNLIFKYGLISGFILIFICICGAVLFLFKKNVWISMLVGLALFADLLLFFSVTTNLQDRLLMTMTPKIGFLIIVILSLVAFILTIFIIMIKFTTIFQNRLFSPVVYNLSETKQRKVIKNVSIITLILVVVVILAQFAFVLVLPKYCGQSFHGFVVDCGQQNGLPK